MSKIDPELPWFVGTVHISLNSVMLVCFLVHPDVTQVHVVSQWLPVQPCKAPVMCHVAHVDIFLGYIFQLY